MDREEQNRLILAELARLYPDARPALHFANPFELLPAVLISRSTGWSPAPGLGSEHPQAHPSRSPSDDRSRT